MNICLNCENEFNPKMVRAKFCSDICRATFSQNIKSKGGKISVKIYSLINPEDKTVFYVGKTVGSLQQRLNGHIKDKEGNSKKRQIISELAKKNLFPEIVELEEISCENEEQEMLALLREKYWIDYYSKENNLCNVSGAKSKFTPRMLSQYTKNIAKRKTSAFGVRFNQDELELIKTRENLKSAQEVVYFLCSEYCKLYRVENKSVFEFTNDVKAVHSTAQYTKVSDDIPKDFRDKADALGREINKKLIEQLTETVLSGTPTKDIKDNSEIEKQISEIRNEKIPKERDTPLGRKVWYSEQQKRIEELKK